MAIETAADLAQIFSTDLDGETATFTPAVGSPVTVTVLVDHSELGGDVAFPQMREQNLALLVRKSEIADPSGGTFSGVASLGAGSFRVTETALDQIGAIWTVHVAPTT